MVQKTTIDNVGCTLNHSHFICPMKEQPIPNPHPQRACMLVETKERSNKWVEHVEYQLWDGPSRTTQQERSIAVGGLLLTQWSGNASQRYFSKDMR